jgi:hypothetical protein
MSYEIHHDKKDGTRHSVSFTGFGIKNVIDAILNGTKLKDDDAQLYLELAKDHGYLFIDEQYQPIMSEVITILLELETKYLSRNLCKDEYGDYLGVVNLRKSLQSDNN